MKKLLQYFLIFIFATNIVNAQIKAEEKVIGLVEVPGIFGKADPNGPPGLTLNKAIKSIKLYSSPNVKSKIVAEISTPSMIESREHEYEQSSAVVYGQSKNWYLIKSNIEKGWLAPKDSAKFHDYEGLIRDGLSYLNENWDGHYYLSPTDLKKYEHIQLKKPTDVRLIQSKTVNGKLWFHIQIVTGRCTDKEILGKKMWIPAYHDQLKENFWFHSRGC